MGIKFLIFCVFLELEGKFIATQSFHINLSLVSIHANNSQQRLRDIHLSNLLEKRNIIHLLASPIRQARHDTTRSSRRKPQREGRKNFSCHDSFDYHSLVDVPDLNRSVSTRGRDQEIGSVRWKRQRLDEIAIEERLLPCSGWKVDDLNRSRLISTEAVVSVVVMRDGRASDAFVREGSKADR